MKQKQQKASTAELARFSGVLKDQKNRALLSGALTQGLDMDRFIKCAWIQTMISEDVKELAQKNPRSVFIALLQCAQMGLYPDGVEGDAYLVKFGNSCVAIRGYKGLQKIFAANPIAASLPMVFDEIKENDEWTYKRGGNPSLTHEPAKKDRGETTHYYAVARFKDGSVLPKVMTAEEVEGFSQYAKTQTFWSSKHENTRKWMRLKTVIRQLYKELPATTERMQFEQEEQVESGHVTVDDYLQIVSGSEEAPRVEKAEIAKTEAVAAETKRPIPLSAEPDDEQEIPDHPPTTGDEGRRILGREGAIRDDLFE